MDDDQDKSLEDHLAEDSGGASRAAEPEPSLVEQVPGLATTRPVPGYVPSAPSEGQEALERDAESPDGAPETVPERPTAWRGVDVGKK